MAALSNPFDVLTANLFNLLSSQAGQLQRHYMAILIRIYELAEFNRFGLTREAVVAEIVDYLTEQGADAVVGPATGPSIEDASKKPPDEDPPTGDTQEYASWILRRLADAGWLEREQKADRMDCATLEAHARWAQPLATADERHLTRLKRHPLLTDVTALIDHMLSRGIKLEQEAIVLCSDSQEVL